MYNIIRKKNKLKILHGDVIISHLSISKAKVSGIQLACDHSFLRNKKRGREKENMDDIEHVFVVLPIWNLLNLKNHPFPIRMINCVNYIDFIGRNEKKNSWPERRAKKTHFAVEKCDKYLNYYCCLNRDIFASQLNSDEK